jgi:uncharacterized protein YktB (UPF0637 family)
VVTGFTAEDFAVFDLPDFALRMPALKERITPKLRVLGDLLVPDVSELVGVPMYAHVAQHLRRTVNPPVETWVAFSAERKAYKPYVHYRVSVRRAGVKVVVFLEDYAEAKPRFGRAVKRDAKVLAEYLHAHPQIHAFEPAGENGEPIPGDALTQAWLKRLGDRLLKVKGQHAAFAVPIGSSDDCVGDLEELRKRAAGEMRVLLPLLRLGD